MKRTIATIIAGISLSVAISSASAATNFSDINGHWGKDQIEFAVAEGYVDGYPDGTFKPDQNVSRVEFMKLVVDALKYKKNPQTQEWYKPYLDAGVANGLHVADEFPSDKLNDPISREEMARIAVRATGEANYDAKKWMYLATKKGIINGLDDTGTLGTEQPTTRTQAVTVIRRIMKIREGASLPMDKHAASRAEVAWHGTNVFTMWPRYFSEEYIEKFSLDKFKWDSSDGIYHEEVTDFIVVDMEDDNDPYRNEVDGMQFNFAGNRYNAPTNSYVSFSKVKQEIKGQFPLNLYIADGGGISILIAPEDAMSNQRKDWKDYYSQQETSDNIYFTKSQSQETQWNIDKFKHPYYAKDIPSDGGVFYWIKAQVHPKGNFFSFDRGRLYLNYHPNIAYVNNYGPKKPTAIFGVTNYKVQNP